MASEPPPKRGRPRTDPGSRLSTWVRADEHDRLIKLAKTRDTTVSALVRHLLQRTLRH
jgi:hypothetical protein